MRHHLIATLVCLATCTPCATAPLAAQANPDARTLGWQVRADRPTTDPAILSFVEMKPGFHITTGKFSGIMYHPEMTGTGTFEATMKVHFFPPPGQHHEGYGLIVGGRELAGADVRYLYFLIRNSGEFLIKSRQGAETTEIVAWTSNDAIKTLPPDATGGTTALNQLTVRAAGDVVRFLVNGTVVATRPRTSLDVDGVVGIRANHNLNLHVSEIEVTTPGEPAGN